MSKKLDILRYLTAGVFRLKVSLKVVQSDLINTPSYKSRLMRSLPDFSVNMLFFFTSGEKCRRYSLTSASSVLLN